MTAGTHVKYAVRGRPGRLGQRVSQEWREPASDRTIRLFLSSPRDVSDERAVVLEVVERLRYDPFISQVADLRVASWDNPAAPVPLLASEHPQYSIDAMLERPSQCDIVVAIRRGHHWPIAMPSGGCAPHGPSAPTGC